MTNNLKHRKFIRAAVMAMSFAISPLAEAAIAAPEPKMTEVPALRLALRTGDVIRQNNLISTAIPAHQVGNNIVKDAESLIGMAVTHAMMSGRPIRDSDIRQPILAKKGALVKMIVTTPHMVLSATGRAMENGSLGDSIRLINTFTNKSVEGTVAADGSIVIHAGNRLALAGN